MLCAWAHQCARLCLCRAAEWNRFFCVCVECALFATEEAEKKVPATKFGKTEKKPKQKSEKEKAWQRRKPKTASCVSGEKAVCMMMLVAWFNGATTLYSKKQTSIQWLLVIGAKEHKQNHMMMTITNTLHRELAKTWKNGNSKRNSQDSGKMIIILSLHFKRVCIFRLFGFQSNTNGITSLWSCARSCSPTVLPC